MTCIYNVQKHNAISLATTVAANYMWPHPILWEMPARSGS